MRTHKKLSKFKMSYRWKRKLTNLVYPILILALTSAVFLNDKRIRIAGRNTQGVKIIKLSGDEKVVSAIKIDDNLL